MLVELIRGSLGFIKITVVTAVVVIAFLWGGRETVESIFKLDIASNEIMTFIRWSFLEAAVTVVFVFIAIFSRGYYFPAGVFRVDEEKDIQKEKEQAQIKAIKWIVGTLITTFVVIATPNLVYTCTTMDRESTIIETYLKQTNMCRVIRSNTTLTEHISVPAE